MNEELRKELEVVKQNIASKLRGLRAEKNIARDEVAEITGLDSQTIYRYETGVTTQSLDKLVVLARFYGVKLIYFFSQNYENMYRNTVKNDTSKEETIKEEI